MKTSKLLLTISILLVTITIVGLVFALPINKGIDKAKEVSPVIDDDGHVVPLQLPESELTKIVFIRYAPGFQKEKPCNNNGICDAGEKGWCGDCKTNEDPIEPTSSCYGFLAGSKPRWKWTEDYYYNVPELGVSSAIAVSTWESSTTGNIFGSGISGDYPWGVYDQMNSISYGDYDDTGMCPTSDPCVIGVTAIWYQGKNIYEYDIMYDTDFFPGSFDLDTVVLHELGHGAGLDDLYDVDCEEEVMFGYYREIKTNLRSGDITGIQILYR